MTAILPESAAAAIVKFMEEVARTIRNDTNKATMSGTMLMMMRLPVGRFARAK
jgi:hypothetical protein